MQNNRWYLYKLKGKCFLRIGTLALKCSFTFKKSLVNVVPRVHLYLASRHAYTGNPSLKNLLNGHETNA